MTLSSPACKNDRFSRRMEILDLGRVGFLMQWRGTVIVGAPGAGREAGAAPLVVPGRAATIAKVLRGTFREVLPEVGQGHPAAPHGLCRGAPLCLGHLGPARCRKKTCRWMSKMIRVLRRSIITSATKVLLSCKRLILETCELFRKFLQSLINKRHLLDGLL